MNKYKEDFDMVTRLCALDGRERTILNYGIEEGRTKAIDEFAERLQENVESFQTEINGFKADVLTLDYFVEFVYEIAEQLKGGTE